MNKEETEEFYENASNEEKIKREIELLSFGNISIANLDTCMTYGISGMCGEQCPNYKNCEAGDSNE